MRHREELVNVVTAKHLNAEILPSSSNAICPASTCIVLSIMRDYSRNSYLAEVTKPPIALPP
eukprot:6488003-Amphidinium_carterae.1